MDTSIAYIKRQELEDAKWNSCITAAGNGLIYAYTFYLDTMSKHWDALVLGDYEAVMPLTWNEKWGIKYLYQPFFAASLGVFGNSISAELVKRFLQTIPDKFRYWDIYLNRTNAFPLKEYYLYQRRNYVLDLSGTYDQIFNGYVKSHQRNVKRAIQLGNVVETNIDVREVIELAKHQSKNFSPIRDSDYANFLRLYTLLSDQGQAITYGVFDTQKNIVASSVFFFSHGRAYYILVGNHPDGRTSGASHLLIDSFIKEHAAKNLLLDFEGSDIRNLAWFYGGFGAKEEIYAGLKYNRLPALLKLFKQ